MRCLVIEDDADTARYICNGRAEAGHTATLVRNGATGLQLATNEHWDIIILDRMLPGGVDGLSIIATIRGLGKTTPVLILSALASLDERVRGLRGGVDDYLTKPFAFSELLARVEALLRRGTVREDNHELWMVLSRSVLEFDGAVSGRIRIRGSGSQVKWLVSEFLV